MSINGNPIFTGTRFQAYRAKFMNHIRPIHLKAAEPDGDSVELTEDMAIELAAVLKEIAAHVDD